MDQAIVKKIDKEDLCPICKENPTTNKRCTHCDIYICDECWERLDGYVDYKQCPFCSGVFHLVK